MHFRYSGCHWIRGGLVKIMLFFALLLLKNDPAYVQHKFWILEFGFKAFYQFNKK
jgi:hypothetical protein